MKWLVAALLFAASVAASVAGEPTVTLTQTELNALIVSQCAAGQAQSVLKKVQDAFMPKPSAPSALQPAKGPEGVK